MEGYGYFLYETLSRITRDHPEHEFIFIFDRPYDQRFIFNKNVKAIVTGPPARHPFLWKLWYDIKIPLALKKCKADVFVSADGFCSLTTKIPQCLVVHDLAFLHFPQHIHKSHLRYYKKNTRKFLQKAKSVATVSEFSKNDIIQQYNISAEKINVVYSAVKDFFQPVNDTVKTAIKEKFTDGKEYFLFVGAIHPRKNLYNLLKAFSIFKKRLKSNFKLVIAGRLAWKYESFMNSLKTYKFRDDVVLTGYLDEQELAALTASAYASVYPSLFEGFGVPVLEAMQCGVPVVTSEKSSMEEISDNAALYADPSSPESIADKMMLLYKDEELKNTFIEKGKQVAAKYSWDITAALLWQTIMKAVQ